MDKTSGQNTEFGIWLRGQRNRLNSDGPHQSETISGATIARKLGVTRQCYSTWELGKFTPPISRCKDIAKALGLTTEEVVVKAYPYLKETIEKWKSGGVKAYD